MTRTGSQPKYGIDAAGRGARPFRIKQFTDLHLYADPNGRLLGQNTRLTFESVLTLAARDAWPPDALVFTGDLIHDESIDGYRFLRRRIEQLGVRWFCLPGNHDRIDLLGGYTDAGSFSGFRVEAMGAWDLLLLDTTVPFQPGGHLEATVLGDLDRHALANPMRHLLIFLHHHPEPVGCGWIDTMRIDNGGELLTRSAAHANIRGIVCGHVHQAREASRDGLDWMATPSTCVQFLPNSSRFALDRLTPGYRWFELYEDGRIETAVRRTDAYPDPLRPTNTGY